MDGSDSQTDNYHEASLTQTKQLWIIANWKSNLTIKEALDWLDVVGSKMPDAEHVNVVVCPQFPILTAVQKVVEEKKYPILVGAQNVSQFGAGSYTGEVNAKALADLVGLVIIGHSERRTNFNETDEVVSKKVEQTRQAEIAPLVCVQGAETLVPEGCKLIAYEPVFAIGTGTPDSPENANEVCGKLIQKYGHDLEILYGGSVNSENCINFVKQENIAGLLIGKASLNPVEFLKIVEECSKL